MSLFVKIIKKEWPYWKKKQQYKKKINKYRFKIGGIKIIQTAILCKFSNIILKNNWYYFIWWHNDCILASTNNTQTMFLVKICYWEKV